MGLKEREKTLENIAILRRVEKAAPDADVALVREDLEAQLGGVVSRNLSASLLGVSHTALNNWIAAGDVPVVISERGRKEVPIPTLLELRERVEEERRTGRRKLHTLEPASGPRPPLLSPAGRSDSRDARFHGAPARPLPPSPGASRSTI